MKIGVLTSSRADYGIYTPLLKHLKEDPFFELEIIAFGTHMSKFHGYTVENIEKHNYQKIYRISTILANDDKESIATSYALTAFKFANFWAHHKFDLVLCLGDRFEMNAAVQAGIPFGLKLAHIHGGETTLGAIDNIYRHQITLISHIHFTATETFRDKISEILGQDKNIHIVGALSLDEIKSFKPIEKNEFYDTFKLKDEPFALVTFHPETVSAQSNISFVSEMKKGLAQATKLIHLVITMPNADTLGSLYRDALLELKEEFPEAITLIENFGKVNYFSAMQYAALLIGNTSSGIIEAASFNKYVLNVGDRQKGRLQSENIINVNFNESKIIEGIKDILKLDNFNKENIYYKNDVSKQIVSILKSTYDKL